MKKFLLTAVACSLLSSSAFAACTHEEMVKKMTDTQAAIQALAQKDLKKFSESITKFQGVVTKFQGSDNLDEVCKLYDELAETLK